MLICLAFFLMPLIIQAQFIGPDHRNLVRFTMDNDYFVWFNNYDRYYSYGLKTQWERLRKPAGRENSLLSGIFNRAVHGTDSYEFAIKAYTPENKQENPSDVIRPFAGWTYAAYEPAFFFPKSVLRTKLMVGFLGPRSQAGEVQNWFHENIDEPRYEGWENQVDDKVGVNLDITYYLPLVRKRSWELYTNSRVKIGNIFIEACPNLGLRLGKFRSPNRELFEERDGKSEYFLELEASLRYAMYDATIEAGPDYNEFYDLNTISGIYEASFHYSLSQLFLEIGYVYTHGSVDAQTYHNYGRLSLGFLF